MDFNTIIGVIIGGAIAFFTNMYNTKQFRKTEDLKWERKNAESRRNWKRETEIKTVEELLYFFGEISLASMQSREINEKIINDFRLKVMSKAQTFLDDDGCTGIDHFFQEFFVFLNKAKKSDNLSVQEKKEIADITYRSTKFFSEMLKSKYPELRN